MINVYVREMAAEWGYTYKKFKPTGRWKTRILNGTTKIFVEHNGLIFNSWYAEDDVVFEDIVEYVNSCGEG